MSEHHPNPATSPQGTGIAPTVSIPPRPALLMALQRELRKDDPHLKKIAELIGRDVAMAGKLLETANSAFFNLSRRVASVDDAIALIGMSQCDAIMTGLITRRALANGPMMMARFWDVSEKRAKGMSFVARATKAVRPETAHNFGLFCDIGIPLLKVRFADYLDTLSIANRASDRRFTDVEDERHGINHAQVGALLAEHWGIESEVVHAIRLHHAVEALRNASLPASVRALIAANLIVEKAIQDFRGDPDAFEWREGGQTAAAALGMSADDVATLCGELTNQFSGRG